VVTRRSLKCLRSPMVASVTARCPFRLPSQRCQRLAICLLEVHPVHLPP
jgi:hypothetical protein